MSDRQRSHQVFCVVRAANLAMIHVEQRPLPIRKSADQQSAIEMNIRLMIVGAESDRLRWYRQIQLPQSDQCFALDNCPVERLLVPEQSSSGPDVVIGIRVTIQVVWCQIH